MRRSLLLALLITLPLAGCIQTDPSPPGAPAEDGPRVLPWGIARCRYFVFEVPVRADALRPHLPEGFEPATGSSPLTPVRGESRLGIEAIACEEGVGLDGNVSPLDYGSFFTAVTPPENLSVPDADIVFVKWDVLVPDAPRREVLVEAGLPARAGRVAFAEPVAQGPRLTATLDMEGVGPVVIDGVISGAGGPFNGTFVEYMPSSKGGLAAWRTDYASEPVRRGTAVATLPREASPRRSSATPARRAPSSPARGRSPTAPSRCRPEHDDGSRSRGPRRSRIMPARGATGADDAVRRRGMDGATRARSKRR